MDRAALVALLFLFTAVSGITTAHGFITTHEAETLVIVDDTGEDSFAWGGYDVWQVYVGEAYNATLDAEGVYVKFNAYGDGTLRTPDQDLWTLTVAFTLDGVEVVREASFDGTGWSTDFDSLETSIEDGNALHFKGFVAVDNGTAGSALADLTVLSSVDGDPRDYVPGGVSPPGTTEQVPAGESGYATEVVQLVGPTGYLDVAVEEVGDGAFAVTTTSSLQEAGQHVFVRPRAETGWNATVVPAGTSLNGGESHTFHVNLTLDATAGSVVRPLVVDVLTDIGGREVLYGVYGADGITLVTAAADALPGQVPEALNASPSPGVLAVVGLAGVAAALGISRRRAA